QGTVAETNEQDNISQVLGVGVIKVAIENTQTPDLLGAGLTASGAVTQLTKGSNVALNYTVRNDGKKGTGSIASDVAVRFYLYRLNAGEANVLNLNDTQRTIALGVTDDDALFLPDINGETTAPAQLVEVILPSASSPFWANNPAGTRYFIGMVSDSGSLIAESDELNNQNVGLGLDSIEITVV
ncbi:MAG: hypothetical protein HC805_02605, partial [Alkalinema sp. RL_2_19]|nr:hypothetical protein [Alkalinema sp. RL_2_19]